MLIRYPPQETVNNITHIKTQKSEKYAYIKTMALLRVTKGNNSNSIGP